MGISQGKTFQYLICRNIYKKFISEQHFLTKNHPIIYFSLSDGPNNFVIDQKLYSNIRLIVFLLFSFFSSFLFFSLLFSLSTFSLISCEVGSIMNNSYLHMRSHIYLAAFQNRSYSFHFGFPFGRNNIWKSTDIIFCTSFLSF